MTEEKVFDQRPLWVFGYASLMWDPGFDVAESQIATLRGFHRSFCMKSIHHRGSKTDPGLVLALDKQEGAECHGLALRVPDGNERDVVKYLRSRELISSAYVEHLLGLSLANGTDVTALAYVIDPDHEQYCAGMSLEDQAQIIAKSVGGRGPNTEYLWNTVKQLEKMGLRDDDLLWLDHRVRLLTQN